jgi:hypothetical protein
MPDGIPAPDAGRLILEAETRLQAVHNLGSLVPTFEVRTDSSYAWLNTARFLSSNPGIQPGGRCTTARGNNSGWSEHDALHPHQKLLPFC